jgi:hypothetical protein
MLQVPIPKDIDGKVIEKLFDETSSLACLPQRSNDTSQRDASREVAELNLYSKQDEKEVRQRLKILGYI